MLAEQTPFLFEFPMTFFEVGVDKIFSATQHFTETVL